MLPRKSCHHRKKCKWWQQQQQQQQQQQKQQKSKKKKKSNKCIEWKISESASEFWNCFDNSNDKQRHKIFDIVSLDKGVFPYEKVRNFHSLDLKPIF